MKLFASLPKPIFILLSLYSVILWIFSIFSYAFTDPNLVLLSWQPYQDFQFWMWRFIGSELTFRAAIFGVLIFVTSVLYISLIFKLNDPKVLKNSPPTKSSKILWLVMLVAPLFVSMNALSHDVFNYMFNAKMVAIYSANPHVSVALDFPQDLWTRFMHNTHTPAPYGYGWTGLSMIPFGLGFGMFFTTWFAFKLFMISALYALYEGLQKLAVAMRGRELSVGQISLLFLNPLFLIETISSAHNDVWMMALAVWSLAFVMDHKKGAWHIIFSGLLLIASISIKYVTILIVPIWLFLVIRTFLESKLQNIIKKKLRIQSQIIETVFQKSRDWANLFIPPILSWILFIPLLTARSQQFHPWYLIWVITWLPFISTTWWKWSLVALSISSLLRYLPWIANGAYSAQILASQKNITWIPFFIMVVLQILWWHSHKDKA